MNRLRTYKRRALEQVRVTRSTRQTALKVPDGQFPPHPSAFGSYGDNSWIVPPARVLGADRMHIGSNVVVMEFSSLAVLDGGRLSIGDGCKLARFISIVAAAEVVIEDDVLSSDGVVIGDTWRLPMGPASVLPVPPAEPVRIGQGAYLAFNSCILPGVTVGEGAYVAENAVVTEDVPAHSVAVGNPAQIIRRYDPETGAWEGKQWP